MKIVYLNPVGALGGGERSLLDLLASLRKADPQLQGHLIVCTDGPLIEAAKAIGVQVQLLQMPAAITRAGDSRLRNARFRELDTFAGLIGAGFAAKRYASVLRDAIVPIQPDIVHSNGIKTHLLTSLARLDQIPRIWHVRDFLSSRPLVGRLLRYAANAATSIIANSQAVADDVRATLGRKSALVPLEVVYNGIDTAHFSPGSLKGADETIRVGIVATYARWKGQDLFLQAARRVIERNLAVAIRFYIIGGPIYQTAGSQFSESELRALAARLGISQQVEFVPFQDDPLDSYRSLDVVVHASTQPEPFGRTIVEAMSCARAVIVSAEGGASELFRDGTDAIAVPPRDADALANGIMRVVLDPALRQRLGCAARETATQRFDRARLGPQILQIYRRLLRPWDDPARQGR